MEQVDRNDRRMECHSWPSAARDTTKIKGSFHMGSPTTSYTLSPKPLYSWVEGGRQRQIVLQQSKKFFLITPSSVDGLVFACFGFDLALRVALSLSSSAFISGILAAFQKHC